jgi:cGMP-dependent protein kinase
MFYCELGAKEFVFKQGDNASSYLILQKGSCEVLIDEKVVRTLKSGEGFGELALLYGAPRSASIRTLEPCGLWGIDRHTFRRAVEEMVVKQTDENRKFIEAVRFFRKTVENL